MIESGSEENKESSFGMEFPVLHLDHLNSEVQDSNYESLIRHINTVRELNS